MGSALGLSGFNGIDTDQIISGLMQQARLPVLQLQSRQVAVQGKISALQTLSGKALALRTAADNLADLTLFDSKTVSSSDSSAIGASASSTAAAGTYSVAVTDLARAETKLSQTGYAAADSILGMGTITINVGSANNPAITIDSTNNTLQGVRDAINQANVGVRASIVNTGSGATPFKLMLVGSATGASNTVAVSATLDGAGWNFDTTETARSASLTVNNIPITSASNSVADAIAGVTLNLSKPNSSATVTVGPATSAIKSKITALVNAYNDLNTFFTSQSGTDPKKRGPLAGDATLSTVRSATHDALVKNTSNGGAYSGLFDLGIDFQEAGSLKVDDAKLTAALTDNLGDVKKFFQGTGSDGFAHHVQGALKSLTDATLSGIVPTSISTLEDSVDKLQARIAAMETRLDTQRKGLQKQFLAMQQAITQMNSQAGALANLNTNLFSAG